MKDELRIFGQTALFIGMCCHAGAASSARNDYQQIVEDKTASVLPVKAVHEQAGQGY